MLLEHFLLIDFNLADADRQSVIPVAVAQLPLIDQSMWPTTGSKTLLILPRILLPFPSHSIIRFRRVKDPEKNIVGIEATAVFFTDATNKWIAHTI